MNPGATAFPDPSIVFLASKDFGGPAYCILSPVIARVPIYAGAPVPS